MTTVLVTGGTGALGSQLVPRLVSAGHDVRVLSRKDRPDVPPGVTSVRGDIATGDGLAAAVSDAEVIAHLASGTGGVPSYNKAKRTDVDGTVRLLDAAAGAGRAHVVYISIVGIDTIPLGYYRAKLDAERAIERSGLPFTILRTTQFHTLAWDFCGQLTRLPIVLVPNGMSSQLIDASEVAERFAGLVAGEPAGHVPDMGGPEVLSMIEIVRSYVKATGKRRAVVPLPLPGKTMRAFTAGHNLAPDHRDGRITWDEYLSRAI